MDLLSIINNCKEEELYSVVTDVLNEKIKTCEKRIY